MKATPPFPNSPQAPQATAAVTLSALLLALAPAPPALGQAAVEQLDTVSRSDRMKPAVPTSPLDQKLPVFTEDDLEDLGPQFLLLRKQQQQRDHFQLTTDLQLYWTSNPTQLESKERSSTLTVATAQVAFAPDPYKVGGGQLHPQVGLRYQLFRYGLMEDDDKVIAGAVIDNSDFDVVEPYAELAFERGNYTCAAGIRFSELESRPTGTVFYEEWVPYWLLARKFEIDRQRLVFLQYDGTYRSTETETGGLLPEGINDRTEHAVSVIYSQVLGERWVFQPAYRLQYSYYTDNARDREDIFNTVSVGLSYYFKKNLSARFFVRYETRDSSEPVTQDYFKWDAGLGGTLSWRF